MNNDENAGKRFCFKFLVLVPHQDVRSLLRKHGELLIKEGITGVYQFPWAAPIAELSEELTADELKFFAHSLRASIGNEKIYASETDTVSFPADTERMILFGHHLNLNISTDIIGDSIKKVKKNIFPIILGSWLIPEANEQHFRTMNQKFDMPSHEKLSFRAAAAANMHWKPFQIGDKIGFKWKIGKLSWFPKKMLK